MAPRHLAFYVSFHRRTIMLPTIHVATKRSEIAASSSNRRKMRRRKEPFGGFEMESNPEDEKREWELKKILLSLTAMRSAEPPHQT